MTYNPLGKKIEQSKLKEGSTSWKSPSNIALVKYWGKHGNQLPRNASISFTLDTAHTQTEIKFYPKEDNELIEMEFFFEGEKNIAFGTKIRNYLEGNRNYFPWITQLALIISSTNSFPHSSGIASSASSMSALIMCLMDIESQFQGEPLSVKKASFLSRLASGSASRSLYPQLSIWGAHPNIEHSNDLFAISYENQVDSVFADFHDDILIVSAKEKSVSSTAGHKLMEENIYASSRYEQANHHLEELIKAMKKGDLKTFGEIVESEAMTLHALMMCSNPSYILMEPNTLNIIREIRAFRQRTNHPVFFTLDAGPNIHMLYPSDLFDEVVSFTEEYLLAYCLDGKIIRDKVGQGPKKI